MSRHPREGRRAVGGGEKEKETGGERAVSTKLGVPRGPQHSRWWGDGGAGSTLVTKYSHFPSSHAKVVTVHTAARRQYLENARRFIG